jgi:hypothetical protein
MSWRKEREDEIKTTGLSLWYVFLAFIVIGGICAGSLVIYRIFGPANEAVRRETVENSKSFIDGTVRDLENLCIEYNSAQSADQKNLLRGVILHRASAIDEDRLPSDLKYFIADLKKGGI